MGLFKIVTDTTADLSKEYIAQHDLGLIHLSCLMDGEVYGKEKELDIHEFYDRVREGSLPTTSQANPEQIRAYFETLVPKYTKVLCLAFSSGLSGTCQSFHLAAQEFMEAHPEVEIRVIDTLCASLGEGLLVAKAVEFMEQGHDFDTTCNYISEHVQNLCHVFTVDDLNHLYRGGRVSKAAAVLGSMINIKPILHVDSEGHLININKVRGRKKSLLTLVDMMEERIGSYRDAYKEGKEWVYISHSDSRADAEFVKNEIEKRFGIQNFVIEYIGPVIGSHTGAGTVALFFWGDYR